jgi:hypothetical protein
MSHLLRNRIIVALARSFEEHTVRQRRKESSRRLTVGSSRRRSSKQDIARRQGSKLGVKCFEVEGIVTSDCKRKVSEGCVNVVREGSHGR